MIQRVCIICNCEIATGQQVNRIRQRRGAEESPDDPVLGEAHLTCVLQDALNAAEAARAKMVNLVATIIVAMGGSVRVHRDHAKEAIELGNEFTVTEQPEGYHLLEVKKLIIKPPAGLPRNLRVVPKNGEPR